MQNNRILAILIDVLNRLARENPSFHTLPENLEASTTLDESHISDTNIGELAQALRQRFGGIALNVELMYRLQKTFAGTSMDMGYYKTLGDIARHIQTSLQHGVKNPVVVYVDDEEENLFIFRRQFGKRCNLRTFTDPREALAFISETPDVVLVLTDESMPALSGNALCDAVHESKPFLKFVLITGNPGGDQNLVHKSLRQGRFYDFINKPLDFAGKGEEYFTIINKVLTGEFF